MLKMQLENDHIVITKTKSFWSSACMYFRVFHRNTFLEIHIAQRWFLVWGAMLLFLCIFFKIFPQTGDMTKVWFIFTIKCWCWRHYKRCVDMVKSSVIIVTLCCRVVYDQYSKLYYSMIIWNWNKVNSYISALKPLPRLPSGSERP